MKAFCSQCTPLDGMDDEARVRSDVPQRLTHEMDSSRMTQDKQSKSRPLRPPVAFDPVEAALKQIFNDVASEDVPDDFADLVAQLTTKSTEKKDT